MPPGADDGYTLRVTLAIRAPSPGAAGVRAGRTLLALGDALPEGVAVEHVEGDRRLAPFMPRTEPDAP